MQNNTYILSFDYIEAIRLIETTKLTKLEKELIKGLIIQYETRNAVKK